MTILQFNSKYAPHPPKALNIKHAPGPELKLECFVSQQKQGEVEEEPVTFRRNFDGRIPSGMEEFFDKPII